MKKNKLAMLTLANVALLTLTACGGQGEQRNSSFVKENIPESGDVNPGKPGDNIFDAFEDTRPNYGDIFDYIPGYTKPEPPKPYEKVLVEIDPASGVTFADGTTSKEILGGTVFNSEDFDATNVKDKRSVAGFLVDSEGVNPNTVIRINDLVVGRFPMKLTPVLGAKPGYVVPGFQKFNPSNCHGSFVDNGTINYIGDKPVKGGKGEPTLMGQIIHEPSFITEGSTIRMDMPCSTYNKVSGKEGVFEFTYNFENLGTEDIYINAYQVNGSVEQQDSSYRTKQYRMDIDLKPGESISLMSQNDLGLNDNKLFLIEADRKMPGGMKLGMSVELKLTDLESPTTISKPEPGVDVKINVKLPEGMTIAGDYVTDVKSGQNIVFPTNEQITDSQNRPIKGWYLIDGDKKIVIDNNFIIPKENITIAPYFGISEGQMLKAGWTYDGYGQNYGSDYEGQINTATGEHITQEGIKAAHGQEIIGEDSIPMSLITAGEPTLKVNDYYRLLTYCGNSGTKEGIKGGSKYKFDYTIKNVSTSEWKFELVQVQGGCKWGSQFGSVTSGEITLQPGETKEVSITITLTNNNRNIMPMFIMKNQISNLSFMLRIVKHNL